MNTSTSSTQATNFSPRNRSMAVAISHSLVLILSLLLIIYISYDTFKGINFLTRGDYMTFQLLVCIVFLADFFIELAWADNKRDYFKKRWFFLFISIPYLNIVSLFDLPFSVHLQFYLRFIPLIRGAYALAMVMGYISKNRAVSLMTQYGAILIALVYIMSLIFFFEEHAVNTNCVTFWDSLYFCAMNTTTVGCYFSAVTPVGKIISIICPTAGMLMLPLFTVAVVSKVKQYDGWTTDTPSNQTTSAQ